VSVRANGFPETLSRLASSCALICVAACAARAARAQDPARPAAPDTVRRLPGVVVTATRDTISVLSSPLPTAVLRATTTF
jgi:hypothetical protein